MEDLIHSCTTGIGETSLRSSSAALKNQLNEGEGSFQTKSIQSNPYRSDASVETQQWDHSKYNTTLSDQQSSRPVTRTSSTGTHIGITKSFSKSSQTNYFRDIDPCTNCSNVLVHAAEFLTKLELNYGLPRTASSNLSISNQKSTPSIEQSPKRTGRIATRKEDNIPNISTSTLNDKAIPIKSLSATMLTKHTNTNNQNLNNMSQKKADESMVQNVSQLERMFSSKEKEKRKITTKRTETDKSKEEKKDNIVMDETNIKPKLVENSKKGQAKQKVVAENTLVTLNTATANTTAAEKMQPFSSKLEKTDKVSAAVTLKLKDIPQSDDEKPTDDRKKSARK